MCNQIFITFCISTFGVCVCVCVKYILFIYNIFQIHNTL